MRAVVQSLTAVETVSVYCVAFDSGPVGVSVATFVVLLYVTVAGTIALVPVLRSTMFVELMVVWSIASLNVI